MNERSPYDGMPYYCNYCGMGFAEFIACEDGYCVLESDNAARLRAQRKRNVQSTSSIIADNAKHEEAE